MEGDKYKYKYICEKCNYKTNLKNSYDKHCMSELHKTGKRKVRKDKICEEYVCENCKYTTKIKINYEMHVLNNHSSKEEKKEKFTYYCETCDFGTFGKTFFDKHLQTIKHKKFTK